MDIHNAHTSIESAKIFLLSLALTIGGRLIGFVESNSEILGYIGSSLQNFAWFGVGMTGLVTVFKFVKEFFTKQRRRIRRRR